MEKMNEEILNRYIARTATPEERRLVHAYLLEDIERCYLVLERMRARAMKALHMTDDPVLRDILAREHGTLTFSLPDEELAARVARIGESRRTTSMREVLAMLLEEGPDEL